MARVNDRDGGAALPWPVLLSVLLGVLLVGLALGRGLAADMKLGDANPWFVALVLAPAAGALVALFHPAALPALRALGPRRAALAAAALVLWTFVLPAPTRFDPYWAALLALWAAAPILALRVEPDPGRLTWLGLLVWLVWWIPLDLRWFKPLYAGPGDAYAATALVVGVLAAATFGAFARPGPLELQPPRARDLGAGAATFVAFGLIALPVGFLTGFLKLTEAKYGPVGALLHGLAIALTIALPEELFFRGVLDTGIRPLFRRAWPSLVASSLAFGLMHWNNVEGLKKQLAYLVLATVAGVFYGLAYRRWGLWAAVTAHTLVDLTRHAFLKGRDLVGPM